MLKLLAIQVEKECAEYIKRCLVPGLMYYLCYDYDISQSLDGVWHIIKRDAYINQLDEYFYRIKPDSGLNINISAIVGENGSGKSTIVEIILRMINNCAIRYDIKADGGKLEYVEGVHAKLFYIQGESMYCLSIKGSKDSVRVLEIARMAYGEMVPCERMMPSSELKGNFFYTLVSNYSHYAYNTHDFRKEWLKDSDENTCWLKWLFHKNDGYQTPITLHPYRDQGTISIEREKNLSNQRMLYFFINYAKRNQKGGVFRYINGKKPKYLNLREVKNSKLQEVTLKRYFYDYKNVNLLGEQITFMNNFADSKDKKEGDLDKLIQTIVRPLEVYAEKVLGLKDKSNSRHYSFFKSIFNWIKEQDLLWYQEHHDSLFSWNSDFKQLLTALHNLSLPYEIGIRINRLYDSLQEFLVLNMNQLQRIEILDDVCDYWRGIEFEELKNSYRFDLKHETITDDYKKLSQKEKCYHYIAYKTIDIFETYPSYHDPLWGYSNNPVLFSTTKDDKKKVYNAFVQLLEDVTKEKSHITLKMRQGFYYLKHTIFNQQGSEGYVLNGEKIDKIDGICLSSERLAHYYENENEQNLETLPPPIYERHLLFETKEGKLVDMDTFSSGEKQLLNTQSAIIYHLQNLSSIFKDPTRMSYPQVNIILEEIELYFHPEYQRCFIYSLINLLESSGISENIKDVNILIITHSPFILSDIPKSHVLFLKDGKPELKMQENTFGSNIHSMLTNGFFLPSLPIGEFAHEKINGMFEKLNGARVDRTNRIERMQLYSDINRVGEPYLREQLMRLFNMYYPPYYNDRPKEE